MPLLWLVIACLGCGCCCCWLLLLALARRHRSRHATTNVLTSSGSATEPSSHADISRYLPRGAAQLRARARLGKQISGGSAGEHANRQPPVTMAPVKSVTQQQEQQEVLMAAAVKSLLSARAAMASGRDTTPSPRPPRPASQPAIRRLTSTIHRRHGRQGSPKGWYSARHGSPGPCHLSGKRTTSLPQAMVRRNGQLFAATEHEPTGQRESPASFACWPDGSHLPPTNAPPARVQAMDWLSDAIDVIDGTPSRDCTPAMVTASCDRMALSRLPDVDLPPATDSRHLSPQLSSPQLSPQSSVALEFGGNSEFHPMPLAIIQQSNSDLAAQDGAPTTPPGMAATPQRKSNGKRSFPSLGFRLVWNDAPNAAQDAKGTFGEYETVRTLGKGSFGTAVLLRHRRTGHMVVSKQVQVLEMERTDLSKVERERKGTLPKPAPKRPSQSLKPTVILKPERKLKPRQNSKTEAVAWSHPGGERSPHPLVARTRSHHHVSLLLPSEAF